MQFVRSFQTLEPTVSNGKKIIYMLGYGGYAWQAKRQISLLRELGYRLLVIDFRDVLKRHNPHDLVTLMDEVSELASEKGFITPKTMIVGVSLGGLVGYNLIRRHNELNKLLVITGGDMTHIPSARALRKRWKMDRKALAGHWKDVNIYTPVGGLRDKHVVMLLPKRDRVIDPNEVRGEITLQSKHNDFTIVPTNGGHFRTIISHTILFPKRILPHVQHLERG